MTFSLSTLYLAILFLFTKPEKAPQNKFPAWQPGYLDIHHINTASGNAAFFIFPDGTTMLFDAGAMKTPENNPEHFYLKTNKDHTPGQIIAKYIQAVHPDGKKTVLDYAVISHFHIDHFGAVYPESATSAKGEYLLSGITEIDELMTVKNLIDRNYPNYDYPKGLLAYYNQDESFKNYLKYVANRDKRGEKTEQLRCGSNQQIKLNTNAYPECNVRNLKTNLFTWTGKGDETQETKYDFTPFMENCNFNENPFSLALQINYGDFDYFTGGDMTGIDYYSNILDMETPIAKAMGEVDALSLNHHGYWDADNEFFMKTLHPQVVMHQSRHNPHFQTMVLSRVAALKADFYTNNVHDNVAKVFSKELKGLMKGANGHIVLRVLPKGKQYEVYMLEDDDFSLNVLSKTGPYKSVK